MSYGLRQTALYVPAATGGQTIAVGQVVETDLAQALTWAPKRRLVGQALETDLAQAIARVKTKTVGQAAETDLAQTVARLKTKAIGQVAETDLAQAIAWAPKARLIGQVAEIDLAQAVARIKAKTIGQIAETDLAQTITRPTGTPVGQVAETDLAQAIAWAPKARLVGQVTEIDLAQAVARLKTKAVGQVIETDLALAIARMNIKAVAQVIETDLAQAIVVLGGLQPALIVLANFTLHIPKLVAPSQKYVDLIKATSGLIAYWRLGETSGTTAVDEMGALNGIYSGDFTLGMVGALSGDSNFAAYFGGTSAKAVVLDSPGLSFPNNIFSMEFWMNPDDLTTPIGILNKTPPTGWEYSIFSTSAGSLRFNSWSLIGNDVYVNIDIAYTMGWQHFIWIGTGSQSLVYRNGIIVSTTNKTIANMDDGSGSFEIGRGRNSAITRLMKGSIDEVAIYNVPLTAPDAMTHFETGRGHRDRMLRIPSLGGVTVGVPRFNFVRMN